MYTITTCESSVTESIFLRHSPPHKRSSSRTLMADIGERQVLSSVLQHSTCVVLVNWQMLEAENPVPGRSPRVIVGKAAVVLENDAGFDEFDLRDMLAQGRKVRSEDCRACVAFGGAVR